MLRILAKKTGKGESVGLFIPLPEELAKQFPSLAPEDHSPPHCTFSYIGPVPKYKEEEVLQTIDAICATFRGPVKASLGQLDYFRQPAKEQSVAILPVRFNKDMAALRYKIYVALRDLGLQPPEFSPLVYFPHVTLAYLDGLDVQYKGVLPTGSWSFNSVEVWDLPQAHTIYFGVEGIFELVASRYATKSEAEKEDGEVGRLVRPSPKKKPPRTDLRRENVRKEDPDVDTGDRGDDSDLTLNYKRVARIWLAYSKKKDKEPAWAKGKKFKHKTESGESSEVGWGSLTPVEREKYTKDQAKEEDEAADKKVLELADQVDLTSHAKERAKKELARLQEDDPDTKATLESVEKDLVDRAIRSLGQPTKKKQDISEQQAEEIVEQAFDEASKELAETATKEKPTEATTDEDTAKEKSKAQDKKKKPAKDKDSDDQDEKPDAEARFKALSGVAGQGDLGKLDELPDSVRDAVTRAMGSFSEDQITSLTDAYKATMEASETPNASANWSKSTVDEARKALKDSPKNPDDPASLGEHLAKAVFAERIVMNPEWAGGEKIKNSKPSTKALNERSSRTFDQYKNMDKEERDTAVAGVLARLKKEKKDSPKAQQLNAVLEGITLAQILNGEEIKGREPPPESYIRFAKSMGNQSKAHLLAGTLRDTEAAQELLQAEFEEMSDKEVLDIAGGSDGPLKELGDFLEQRDEFGNYPFGKKHHDFVKGLLRSIASDNMTIRHQFAANLMGGNSKAAEKAVNKATKSSLAANKKLLQQGEQDSFLKNLMADLAKALKDIERRSKSGAQSFVYNAITISEGQHFAQQKSSGTALSKRLQRRTSMSRLKKEAAQKITADLDRLATVFQKEHQALGVSERVALDFAYRCDLLSDHLEKTALTEYDPVDESKGAPQNFDPEVIGEETSGPLLNEPDEAFMKGEFTQQKNRELRERQEAGELGMKPIFEEQTPTPGKQASMEDSISRLKKKASGSLQSVLTLGELADRLRLCQSELKQVPANIGGTLTKNMMSSIQKHLTPIDAVRNDLFSLEGRGESMAVLGLAAIEKIEGAVQEVLPHIKGVIRKLSEEEVLSSPTAQLKLQEWLDLVTPRITMLLDLSAKIVGESSKEFSADEKAVEKATQEAAKLASEEFDHGYDLSE